ncbi:MAG: glycosyltransferase family 39 protein, partial [Anaerolineae bacterium]|nr:glycosyltransferase family 39 protein [Anaerolineae bacterium]
MPIIALNTLTPRTHWPLLLVLLVSLPFMIINLDSVPHIWFDEGLNLNASRVLATEGVYGLPDANGIRLADPAIQTGPPVIMLAALYSTFGPNLTVMRLLFVLVSLGTMIALYALAFRLYGRLAAFVLLLLLLVTPGEDTSNYIMISRQVLGEIPAILCITLGLHVLLTPAQNWRTQILTGLCFGVAVTLKSQVLLVFSVTLFLWAVYRVYRKRDDWQRWLIIIGTMALVYGLDTLWRTGAAVQYDTVTLREGIFIHILPFRALDNLREMGVLARLLLVFTICGGLFWVRWRMPQTHPKGVRQAEIENLIILFALVWVLWFALVSIGWRRYAFIGQTFTTILVAYGVALVWEGWLKLPSTRWLYAGLAAAGVIVGLVIYTPRFANPMGDQFARLVQYIQREVPAEARIVTWEWPISYFTDQNYLMPSTHATNQITAAVFLGRDIGPSPFAPLEDCPDYVLVGSFDVDRLLMGSALAAAETPALFNEGPYELYRIPAENLLRA